MLLFSDTVKMLWSLLLVALISFDVSRFTHVRCLVTDCNCDNSLVLEKNSTSQSSNYKADNVSYTSDRAVDADPMQCAHTLCLLNSWWKIDLLDIYNISCICIYNKEQKNIDLNDAKIYIGNSRLGNSTTNNTSINVKNFTLGCYNNFTCENCKGRYVIVSLPVHRVLALCEVQISGTKKESPFCLIKENKTWEQALYHCRDQGGDLASILDADDQTWAELLARDAETSFVWLGLRYTCTLGFWFWVEDHKLKYSNWAKGFSEKCDTSVAMESKMEHLWYSKPDNETYNFICRKKK